MNKDIDKLIRSVEKVVEIVHNAEGVAIDLDARPIFNVGTFLHTDSETMTEEESAEFERNNPALFAYLRNLEDEISGCF